MRKTEFYSALKHLPKLISRHVACYLLAHVLFLVASTSAVEAQTPFREWAEGKKAGVFVSRKNFYYTQDWLQFLNQFTQLGGDEIPREDLKLGVLVRLGDLLSQELSKKIPSTQFEFLNASPQKAGAWLEVLSTPSGKAPLPNAILDYLDFIVNIESLNLYANQERSVYSSSNQIRSERRKIYHAEAVIRITDGRNHLLSPPITLKITNSNPEELSPAIDLDNSRSPGGKILAALLSGILTYPM